MTEGTMTTIILKLQKLNFLGGRRGYDAPDLRALSDRDLSDIGFRLARRDLGSVKPFWLA
jgi:hypothetical protein